MIIRPFAFYDFILKKLILRKFKKFGQEFLFDPRSKILTPHLIEVGDNVFIGEGAHISAELTIGNNVMFGPRPIIIGGDHIFAVRGRSVRVLHPKRRENSKPIIIDDDAWFGACVIILKGVNIGMGAVIGAGSVVTRDIPPYVVCVGNPCKPIKKIFSDDALHSHLIALGKDENTALRISESRIKMLKDLHIERLPIVDNTNDYWEFKSEFNAPKI